MLRDFRAQLSALKELRPFLRTVWQTSRSLTVTALSLRLVNALQPLAVLYVGKLIIDTIVHLAQLPGKPDTFLGWIHSGQVDHLGLLILIELGLTVAGSMLGALIDLFGGLLERRIGNSLGLQLVEHAALLDLANFEDAEFLDRLERARRQAGSKQPLLGELLDQAEDIATVVSLAAGVIVLAPVMLVVLLLSLVPMFFGETHFNNSAYELDVRRTEQAREIDYLRQVATTADAAKEVKVFGLRQFIVERFRRLTGDQYGAYTGLAVRRAGWTEVFAAIGTLGYYAAYVFVAWRTIAGILSIGDLAFLAESFRRLRDLIDRLLTGFSSIAGHAMYLRDLYAFLGTEPKTRSPANPRPFPRPIRQGFTFENVGFRYPGAERWTLRNLSFSLEAGKVSALVGENGVGKTTIVKLLTRLYDPTEGRVLLDGHDLRDYDVDELHARMGVVFQDFVRYNFSAAENIAMGAHALHTDPRSIERAARHSRVHDIISGLPEGYGQMIGRRFEKGLELSGGEWQRIALARAYVSDADVLILDEPSSALDARSEADVFRDLRQISKAKTLLLIMHHLSSIRSVDRIIVLANGRAEAVGTHDELMKQPGLYSELFELQAAAYR